MIFHYKPCIPKRAGEFLIIFFGIAATISMFYLPIRFEEYFLDLRLIPLLFLAIMRGWNTALPVLFVASIWRLIMGGPGAVPGTLFGMIFPTIVGLYFFQGETPRYHFKKIAIATTIAWILSDFPTLFFFSLSVDEALQLITFRYVSIIGSSFIFYIFIINGIQQEDQRRRLNQLADFDPLTGLYNKRKFLEVMSEQISQNPNSPYFLALLDLDFFKEINDKFGHLTGDRVLIQFAQYLRQKQTDHIMFARYGGEEFIAFCSGDSLEETAYYFNELRRHLLLEKFSSASGEITPSISVSIGICPFYPAKDVHQQIDVADQLLYEAKRLGRNRVCY
jgi:diguanylate cyclase